MLRWWFNTNLSEAFHHSCAAIWCQISVRRVRATTGRMSYLSLPDHSVHTPWQVATRPGTIPKLKAESEMKKDSGLGWCESSGIRIAIRGVESELFPGTNIVFQFSSHVLTNQMSSFYPFLSHHCQLGVLLAVNTQGHKPTKAASSLHGSRLPWHWNMR